MPRDSPVGLKKVCAAVQNKQRSYTIQDTMPVLVVATFFFNQSLGSFYLKSGFGLRAGFCVRRASHIIALK